MTDETTAGNEHASPAKTFMGLAICRSGQVLVRHLPAITEKLVLPLNLTGDTRLFVKNGEIVRPFLKVEFTHKQTLDVSAMTVGIYEETGAAEFDPTDMAPIAIRSLDRDFDELNPQPQP